jgi:hypothetical protein
MEFPSLDARIAAARHFKTTRAEAHSATNSPHLLAGIEFAKPLSLRIA